MRSKVLGFIQSEKQKEYFYMFNRSFMFTRIHQYYWVVVAKKNILTNFCLASPWILNRFGSPSMTVYNIEMFVIFYKLFSLVEKTSNRKQKSLMS